MGGVSDGWEKWGGAWWCRNVNGKWVKDDGQGPNEPGQQWQHGSKGSSGSKGADGAAAAVAAERERQLRQCPNRERADGSDAVDFCLAKNGFGRPVDACATGAAVTEGGARWYRQRAPNPSTSLL